MQALIGIAFRALTAKEERETLDSEQRKEAAMQEAAAKIAEDSEEWEVAEGNDDGGSPEKNIETPTIPHGQGTNSQRGGRGGGRGGDRGGFGRGGFGRGGKGRGGGTWVPRGNYRTGYQEAEKRVIAPHLRTEW